MCINRFPSSVTIHRSAGCGCGGCWATTPARWTRKRRGTGLGTPPRFPGPRWTRACRAVARDAEPLGFGLSPCLVAQLSEDHQPEGSPDSRRTASALCRRDPRAAGAGEIAAVRPDRLAGRVRYRLGNPHGAADRPRPDCRASTECDLGIVQSGTESDSAWGGALPAPPPWGVGVAAPVVCHVCPGGTGHGLFDGRVHSRRAPAVFARPDERRVLLEQLSPEERLQVRACTKTSLSMWEGRGRSASGGHQPPVSRNAERRRRYRLVRKQRTHVRRSPATPGRYRLARWCGVRNAYPAEF